MKDYDFSSSILRLLRTIILYQIIKIITKKPNCSSVFPNKDAFLSIPFL